MAACLAFINKSWTHTLGKGGHDSNVLSSLKMLQARPGHLRTSIIIEQRHINNHQTIHGGVLLSLTDTVTSLTLGTLGINPPTGVSVNASCEFVRPGGKLGDELIGVGSIVKHGRNLGYTRVDFYTSDGKLVAYGSHTKFMGANQPVTKFSEDGEREIPMDSAKL